MFIFFFFYFFAHQRKTFLIPWLQVSYFFVFVFLNDIGIEKCYLLTVSSTFFSKIFAKNISMLKVRQIISDCEDRIFLSSKFEIFTLYTYRLNNSRIVFDEMSSWTPLTMYLGIKTTFQTKYILSKYMLGFLL